MSVENQSWGLGEKADGKLFILRNNNGHEVVLSEWGASLVEWSIPGAAGERVNIVLGYDDPADYRLNPYYFGATIGRVANRVGHGRFTMADELFQLDCNDGLHSNHGGFSGLSHKLWKGAVQEQDSRVDFFVLSPDGEGGYPGNLRVNVSYHLNDNNELSIKYWAKSDKNTFVNLTHHSYFNLAGEGSIEHHQLKLRAGQYAVTNKEWIPNGTLESICDSSLDFLSLKPLGLEPYNHYFVIEPTDKVLRDFAVLRDPISGRCLRAKTTEPGVQLYTGFAIGDDAKGRYGRRYGPFSGVCLEAQHYPDSPNHPNFPSIFLEAGRVYESEASYQLSF